MDNNILHSLKESFNNLWDIKKIGNTLEISTPAATTTRCFISVFLTIRDGRYIITDGGWISDSYYNEEPDFSDNTFNQILEYYSHHHDIQTTYGKGRTYYYKTTDNQLMISSVIFDMMSFIQGIVNALEIKFSQKRKHLTVFQREGTKIIKDYIHDKNRVRVNDYIDDTFKAVTFHNIIASNKGCSLINYISGSKSNDFHGSIGKSLISYELIEGKINPKKIRRKISIIDVNAKGYDPVRNNPMIDLHKKNGVEIYTSSQLYKVAELVD